MFVYEHGTNCRKRQMTEIRIHAAPEPNIAPFSTSGPDCGVSSLPLRVATAEPSSRPGFTPVDRCERLAGTACEKLFIRKSNEGFRLTDSSHVTPRRAGLCVSAVF